MKSAKAENPSESDDDGDDGEGEISQMDLMGSKLDQQSPYNPNPDRNTWKRRFSELENDEYSGAASPNAHVPHNQIPATDALSLIPEARNDPVPRSRAPKPERPGPFTTLGELDVVGRGLVPATTADELFIRYTKMMTPHMPIVVFPDDTTSEIVRNSSPILFLAILSVAAGENYQDLQIKLNKEIMHTLAGRIIIRYIFSTSFVSTLHWLWGTRLRTATLCYQFHAILHRIARRV